MLLEDFIRQLATKVSDAGAEDADIVSIGTGRDNTGATHRRYIVVTADKTYSTGVKVRYKIEINDD